MKRIIRLTESDLTRIVKRVIVEQDEQEMIDQIDNLLDQTGDQDDDERDFPIFEKIEALLRRKGKELKNSWQDIQKKLKKNGRKFMRKVRRFISHVKSLN
jgi:ElaB/YqjD/DUF883 family membrane-anchored ribosome-binding protein